jgi:hypothetical protein
LHEHGQQLQLPGRAAEVLVDGEAPDPRAPDARERETTADQIRGERLVS